MQLPWHGAHCCSATTSGCLESRHCWAAQHNSVVSKEETCNIQKLWQKLERWGAKRLGGPSDPLTSSFNYPDTHQYVCAAYCVTLCKRNMGTSSLQCIGKLTWQAASLQLS